MFAKGNTSGSCSDFNFGAAAETITDLLKEQQEILAEQQRPDKPPAARYLLTLTLLTVMVSTLGSVLPLLLLTQGASSSSLQRIQGTRNAEQRVRKLTSVNKTAGLWHTATVKVKTSPSSWQGGGKRRKK